MLRYRVSPAPIVAGILVASCAFASASEPRAVIELFTSQGCSSCPPADKLLGELAGDATVVALSIPVDYWDYLGWKDTLANSGHSARQQAYAHVRGDREVYTPQIVVNGSIHVLGSDHSAVERAITVTGRNTSIMSVPVEASVTGSNLSVKVTAGRQHAGGEVWLCPLARSVPVEIGRGENRGHTVTYHNVVRHWVKLGDFTGSDQSWSVPIADIVSGDVDGAAVLVQQGTPDKPGVIMGAAFVPIPRQTTETSAPATAAAH
jgi:hypothetical protein